MRVVCPHCLKVNNIPKKDSYKKANCGGCKNSLLDNKVIELNPNNFDEVLVNSDIPVIVDFWAPWCGPCISFAPTFKLVAAQFPLKALFVKVNTEEQQQLGARFQIESIPTLMVFKDGIQVSKISGAMDKTNFTNFVNSYL
jgi:thioredoxin 2